ncbi:hypothetical protein ISF_09812 [Cordyceps fumosorosea ARSEF 2679]|uniref:Uncharacterized protein n=1 Tax=Cordyceps fumosorosea (strain ARSEF 2679) TaxID=1081104 RepID=A0A162M5I3_CORFA|nr:hypothetical protein ISF_09812 [Cordyceps fumosorosea ARSEF 2679]OAA40371.1 hypothetical protein ISF_09812 [Cordyceps fumosorosea ARSEF 2679]
MDGLGKIFPEGHSILTLDEDLCLNGKVDLKENTQIQKLVLAILRAYIKNQEDFGTPSSRAQSSRSPTVQRYSTPTLKATRNPEGKSASVRKQTAFARPAARYGGASDFTIRERARAAFAGMHRSLTLPIHIRKTMISLRISQAAWVMLLHHCENFCGTSLKYVALSHRSSLQCPDLSFLSTNEHYLRYEAQVCLLNLMFKQLFLLEKKQALSASFFR